MVAMVFVHRVAWPALQKLVLRNVDMHVFFSKKFLPSVSNG